MRTTASATRWLRAAVTAGLALVLAAGCAGSTVPAENVPELRTRLSAVDRAIADHRFGKARRQIERLVAVTVTAREAGSLELGEAEPILAAAASLVSALPEQRNRAESPPAQRRPVPEPDQGENVTEPDAETGVDKDEQEKRREELEKKREELQKKREELQKKLEEEQKKEEEGGGEEGGGEGDGGEEGGGNGDSSENGPDDGHGN